MIPTSICVYRLDSLMSRAYRKTDQRYLQQCLPIEVLRNVETRMSDLLGVIESIGESQESIVYGRDICLQGNHTLLSRTKRDYRRRRIVYEEDEYDKRERRQSLRRFKGMKARRLESGITNSSIPWNQPSTTSLFSFFSSMSSPVAAPPEEEVETESETYLMDHLPSPLKDETTNQIDSLTQISDKTNANMLTTRALFNST